jgi:hypothetical protein
MKPSVSLNYGSREVGFAFISSFIIYSSSRINGIAWLALLSAESRHIKPVGAATLGIFPRFHWRSVAEIGIS